MVNPGGTGRPIRHISARFAPLPPSSGFIVPLPSVFLPNRYTNLSPLADFAEDFAALPLSAPALADVVLLFCELRVATLASVFTAEASRPAGLRVAFFAICVRSPVTRNHGGAFRRRSRRSRSRLVNVCLR